jgi:antagonist of KipI
MSISILKAGICETVQDEGRYGYSGWGINPCGVMDRFASSVANALVGNEQDTAVIEIHFPAFEILFRRDALISLTGADFSPLLNSRPVPVWSPLKVINGSVLSFAKKQSGCRCYLSVRGGFDMKPWLNSHSTHVKIGAGGVHGGILKKGDEIFLNEQGINHLPGVENVVMPWSVNNTGIYSPKNVVSFLEGNEYHWLEEKSKIRLLSSTFTVASSSDRMAYSLIHDPLEYRDAQELISSAVSFGTIQGLPEGRLIILMADHQTTGGYPRLGHVCSAHLPRLSQLGPSESFTFQKIAIEDAEKMVLSLDETLQKIHRACSENLKQYHG